MCLGRCPVGVIDTLANEQAGCGEVGRSPVTELKRYAGISLCAAKSHLGGLAGRQVGDGIAEDIGKVLHHSAVDFTLRECGHTLCH